MNASPITLDPAAVGRTLDDLAAIGNRFAGTDGESACRDYLLERFGELGLSEVRLEPFDYLAFESGPATCIVAGPDRLELECHPLQYTAPAEASGEAIYLGEATEADFQRLERRGVDLRGRIVLVHTVFPFDLRARLQEHGIAGLVHICETPDEIVGTFAGALYPPPLSAPWAGRPTSYCGVTVGHTAGRALVSTLTCGAPAEIRIVHHGTYRERATANLVGVIPGSEDGEVILSAHYDSQAEGSGIFDNGGGLASLLETARVLLDSAPRRRIVFLASAAEGGRRVGRHRLRPGARRRAAQGRRDGQPRRHRQRLPLAPGDLVGRRRTDHAGRADRREPRLDARPDDERAQHLRRSRSLRRRRGPVVPDLAT